MRTLDAVILMAFAAMSARAAEVSKMALVTIDVTTEVTASAESVWSALTRPEIASLWYPAWEDLRAGMPELTVVGRTVHFTDEYGNQGQSVVLYVAPLEEIRIAHVPHEGTYLCQTTIALQPAGGKTKVRVREQYSDRLDVPVDRGTAAMTRDGLVSALASLKKLVE